MAPPRKRETPLRIIAPNNRSVRFGRIGELPKTIRPTQDEPLQLNKITEPDEIIVFRNKLTQPRDERAALEARAVSESVTGQASIWERIVYKWLQTRRIPFDFQSSFFGGRRELGSLRADFVLLDRPLIINPLGRMWHDGQANRARDSIQNDQLYHRGYEVLMIWDDEVKVEPLFEDIMHRHLDNTLGKPVPLDTERLLGGKRVY